MAFTIAIDGPAAAGKGTLARAVAEHFDLPYLDTGLLYRATGRRVLDGADPVEAARSLTDSDLTGQNLRNPDVAQAASKVAALPEVRTALLNFQRTFARRENGAVLDGRDIGTVICPEAEVKLFITAKDDVRAQRRLDELRFNGHDTDLATVLADLRARDARDAAREAAPLKPAETAIEIDTSEMSITEAIAAAIAAISSVREG
ncbi:MAG: (d)CMP kinase [Pseudomonadota bacterium]